MFSILCYAGLAYLPVCGTSPEMSGGAAGLSKGKQPTKRWACLLLFRLHLEQTLTPNYEKGRSYLSSPGGTEDKHKTRLELN